MGWIGGVDHHDGRAGVLVGLEVVERYATGLLQGRLVVEPGDVDRDQRSGREAVSLVPLRGVDWLAGRVARHGQQVEVDAATRGGLIQPREVVVGERLEADGGIEVVAVRGARRLKRLDALGPRQAGRHEQPEHRACDQAANPGACSSHEPQGRTSRRHSAAVSYVFRPPMTSARIPGPR